MDIEWYRLRACCCGPCSCCDVCRLCVPLPSICSPSKCFGVKTKTSCRQCKRSSFAVLLLEWRGISTYSTTNRRSCWNLFAVVKVCTDDTMVSTGLVSCVVADTVYQKSLNSYLLNSMCYFFFNIYRKYLIHLKQTDFSSCSMQSGAS